jgi:hypothetical protein
VSGWRRTEGFRTRARRIFIIALAATLLAFAASAAASSQSGPSGNGVTPQVVAANADCTQVQASSHSAGPPGWSQYTNDRSFTGTFTSADGQLIVNLSSSDQTTFSFTVADSSPTKVVQAVIADDSQAGNFYDYSPHGTSGDTNLHPPPEQSQATAAWFISRLQFCYIPPRQQTPVTPTSQTTSPTTTTAPVTTTAPSTRGPAGQKVAAKKKHKKVRHRSPSRQPRKRVGFTG